MHITSKPPVLAWVFLAALSFTGCQRVPTPAPAPADVNLEGETFRVSGPYGHENLTVFFIHADSQDDRDFLTLDEGLTKGLVKVTEKDQAQVSELQIDNQSDRPLFLQEGERLQGGKQDRTIIASLVLPPSSGPTPVRTCCIERSRWVEGSKGKEFGFTTSPALAPKGVRGAAKFESNQGKVWFCVGGQKVTAQNQLSAPNTNSSINETLDSTEVQKVLADYARVLNEVLREHPTAVGMAILVNDRIEEIDVYPNHTLFSRLYPRLIQSYALQARMLKNQPRDGEPVTPDEVTRFMKDGKETSPPRTEKIAGHNEVQMRQMEGDRFECRTRYDGKLAHWQVMKKNGVSSRDVMEKKDGEPAYPAGSRMALLASDW
jgi:hypothetical protein